MKKSVTMLLAIMMVIAILAVPAAAETICISLWQLQHTDFHCDELHP